MTTPTAFPLPTKEAITNMEPFIGLGLNAIHLVTTPEEAETALEDLLHHPSVGFDTESKPTFRKGQISEGPHVLQFATLHGAYIFQTCVALCQPVIARILESRSIIKAGFGLNEDIKRIASKLKINPQSIIDLDHTFHTLGQKNSIGTKTAIALLFNKRMIKSRKATTSNWSNGKLSEKQLLYAANDAFAAIEVYEALKARGIAVI